ncbi:MAG: hypothetical protein VXY33_08385 [Verrucomicrobiota bacterium]|nr:hypothetical protein [Verrucomicrobiota bacterium]
MSQIQIEVSVKSESFGESHLSSIEEHGYPDIKITQCQSIVIIK